MKYVLAPLAGFTDAPFRRLCREGGADLTYGEMVSAAGLAHGSDPTFRLLDTMPGEGDVAMQIFGADEKEVAFSAKVVSEVAKRTEYGRIVELNLNAGCPVPKVVRCGAGARLIADPDKIHRLLKAMVENTSIPITLKTRLGPHPKDTRIFEIVDAAQSAGVKGIIVHARYTSQMHGGPVALDTLAEVVRRATVPITGNGSVVDTASAAKMEATGVSAIMIGRAALAKPWIFSQLKGGLPSMLENYSAKELASIHLKYLLDFRELQVERYPQGRIASVDGYASVKMHVHLFRYFAGLPGAAALRKRLSSIRTLDEIRAIL
jgi:nifR3 family TIM-barrel protein